MMGSDSVWSRARQCAFLLAIGLFGTVSAANAQESRAALLVSAEWLMEHQDEEGIVVLQAQSRSYANEHIPGARQMLNRDIVYSRGDESDPDMLVLELPEDLSLTRAAFEAAGVSTDTHVVVTFSGAPAFATRLIWTAQVLGLGHVSLLDGGNAAWVSAGGTLVSELPNATPGVITTSVDLSRLADKGVVQSVARRAGPEDRDVSGVALLDARRPASFNGLEEEIPGRAGHIPGARNVPLERLFGSDGKLASTTDLREIFQAAGVEDGDQVVAYCHIGLRATGVLFAAQVLGFEAMLYDGSMAEWARDPSLPLVGGR